MFQSLVRRHAKPSSSAESHSCVWLTLQIFSVAPGHHLSGAVPLQNCWHFAADTQTKERLSYYSTCSSHLHIFLQGCNYNQYVCHGTKITYNKQYNFKH